MNKQKQLIRQELSESILMCMDTIVCLAGDLESVGDARLAEATRSLAGDLENFVLNMRDGGNFHG